MNLSVLGASGGFATLLKASLVRDRALDRSGVFLWRCGGGQRRGVRSTLDGIYREGAKVREELFSFPLRSLRLCGSFSFDRFQVGGDVAAADGTGGGGAAFEVAGMGIGAEVPVAGVVIRELCISCALRSGLPAASTASFISSSFNSVPVMLVRLGSISSHLQASWWTVMLWSVA